MITTLIGENSRVQLDYGEEYRENWLINYYYRERPY